MKQYIYPALSLLLFSSSLVAEEDWGDDDWGEKAPYQLRHELSYGYAHILDDDSVNRENNVFNELRSKSQFDYQNVNYSFDLDLEVLIDQLTKENQINIYEVNFLFPFDGGTDLKIGRQVITWGTGDLLFLNDLFPKDWQSFFNGRDDAYLKPPVDAIRLSHYARIVNFEIALMPEFEADKVLTGERYSFYLPGSGIRQPVPELVINQPRQAEVSARIFGRAEAIEWAIYAYGGYFKSPSEFDQMGNLSFSKMNSMGASLRMPLKGGLFNTEFVYYRSMDDAQGNDPYVQNSQTRFLLAFEKEIASNFTLGVQGYWEKTLDYQALLVNRLDGQPLPDENRTLVTLRLTHQGLRQRLMNSLMLFYSPSDEDHYVRYSSSYTLDDHWKLVAGVNLLDGNKEYTLLAQMQDNSNLFFRVSLFF